MLPTKGVRYEFELRAGDTPTCAVYDVRVIDAADTVTCVVEVGAETATFVGTHDGIGARATQVLALARTIARHADGGPWPRRVTRWRQPGVR